MLRHRDERHFGDELIMGMQRGNKSSKAKNWAFADSRAYMGPGAVGVIKGISLGMADSWRNGGSYARTLSYGVGKSTVQGDPATPSLQVDFNGFWSFRWVVASGTRTITVRVKQATNQTPYPSVIVKANAAIGVNSDATGTSAGGAGWVTIGPVTVTPTSAGVLMVELWNNSTHSKDPCYFDHIVTT
jgi:hypothetical protein